MTELTKEVVKTLSRGLPIHNPMLFHNRKDRTSHFPVFKSSFKFQRNKVEIEINDGGIFKYHYTFPKGWNIIDKDDESITYGIYNEVTVKFTHPRTGMLKAQYTIFSDKWKEFTIKFSEKMTEHDCGWKCDKLFLERCEHSKIRNDRKWWNAQLKIEENVQASRLALKELDDRENLLKDIIQVSNDEILIKIPEGVTYPFTFDPTSIIETVSENYQYEPSANQCARLTDGSIALTYEDNANDIYLAESDDGVNWSTTILTSGAGTSHSLAVDQDDRIGILYLDDGFAYFRDKPYGGALSAATQVENVGTTIPDIDVGTDEVFRMIFARSNVLYYTDETDSANWPYGFTGGVDTPEVANAVVGTCCSIWVHETTSYVAFEDGANDPAYKTRTDGGVWSANTVIDNYNDTSAIDVCVDSNSYVFVSYVIYTGADYEVYCAENSGGAFNIHTLRNTEGRTPAQCTIDANDYVIVMFNRNADGDYPADNNIGYCIWDGSSFCAEYQFTDRDQNQETPHLVHSKWNLWDMKFGVVWVAWYASGSDDYIEFSTSTLVAKDVRRYYKGKYLIEDSNGVLYALRVDNSSNLDLYYSENNGLTWTDGGTVTANHYYRCASMCVDTNDTVYIVYRDDSGNVKLEYKTYTILGGFSGATEIANVTGSINGIDYCDCDCGPDDKLRVTFRMTDSSSDEHIVYTDADDSGSWPYVNEGGPTKVSDGTNICQFSHIIVDSDNNAHVLFTNGDNANLDLDIAYRKRNSGGAWDAIEDIDTSGTNAYDSNLGNIIIDSSGDLHAVWQQERAPFAGVHNIRYATKPSGGAWSGITEITNDNTDPWSGPRITRDQDDNLYITYFNGSGTYNIHYKKYDGSWGSDTELVVRQIDHTRDCYPCYYPTWIEPSYTGFECVYRAIDDDNVSRDDFRFDSTLDFLGECPYTPVTFPSAPPYNTEKYWSDLDTDRIIRNGITILSGSYSITTEQQVVYGYAIFLQDELPHSLPDPFNRVRCRLDVIPTEDEQEVIFGVITNYVFSTRTGIFYGVKITNAGVYAINGNFSIDGVGEGTVVADTETLMTYCDVSMLDDEWCFLDVSIGAVDVDINLYDSSETSIAHQTVPNKSSTNGYCGYCLYEKHEDKPEVKPYFDDCYIDDSSPYE